MGFTRAVAAHFNLIYREKCSGGYTHGDDLNLEVGWMQIDARCLLHVFTAALGYVLVIAVALGQIPLLVNILRVRSGKACVSRVQVFLLVLGATGDVTYAVDRQLPISAWGESILQLTEYVIIMNLLFVYHGRHRNAICFMLLYIVVMVTLLWPLVPTRAIFCLKIVNLPIAAGTKMYLIFKSAREKRCVAPCSSGLPVAVFKVSSSLGRLLTAVVDTRDPLLVTGYFLHALLDCVITRQVFMFRSKEDKGHDSTTKENSSGQVANDTKRHDSFSTRHDNFSQRSNSFSIRRDSLSPRREGRSPRHNSFSSRRESLSSRHDSLSKRREGFNFDRVYKRNKTSQIAGDVYTCTTCGCIRSECASCYITNSVRSCSICGNTHSETLTNDYSVMFTSKERSLGL